jgi:hypothetical protein
MLEAKRREAPRPPRWVRWVTWTAIVAPLPYSVSRLIWAVTMPADNDGLSGWSFWGWTHALASSRGASVAA